MRGVAQELRNVHHRTLFVDYINTLEGLQPDTQRRMVPDMDRAFEVGTDIEAQEIHGLRRTLILVGAVLVVLGTIGQMLGSMPPDWWQQMCLALRLC